MNTSTNPGKSRPVVLAMSILAGYQILVVGAAFGDVVGKDTAALLVLIGAATQAGIQFWVQNQVVPVNDVVEYTDAKDIVRAGPANEISTGNFIRRLDDDPHAQGESSLP